MIAVLEAHRAGLFRPANWWPNLAAGLVVAVVSLPLAMAFAISCGAQPAQGLYTAIVAGMAVSLLGGSRLQIAGPTGAFAPILLGIAAQYGGTGLLLSTILAGLILIVMGLARLGSIIKYIPDPVVTGFTAGIGITVFVSQWPYFFGLTVGPKPAGEHFHEMLIRFATGFAHLEYGQTAGLAALTLLITLATPRLFSRIPVLKNIPGPLIAISTVTVLQAIFQFAHVATIQSQFHGIPQALPRFTWPDLGQFHVMELLAPAFSIAMLGAIQTLMSAVVADGMTGSKHDSNQELIGLGIGNMLAPLFGGFAASGATSRTTTSIRNGGNSPLAGITQALAILLFVLMLAPLMGFIPLASLAAVLFVVAWNMAELPHVIRMLRRAHRTDSVILLTTLFLTVFADLVVAVKIGVILAALIFMRRMAQSVEIEQQDEHSLAKELQAMELKRLPKGILIYSIEGPFFFGAAETFERKVGKTHTDPKVLMIRLGRVPFMDITGIQALEEMIQGFQKRGTRILLSETSPRVRSRLEKAEIIALVGPDAVFNDLTSALTAALHCVEKRPAA